MVRVLVDVVYNTQIPDWPSIVLGLVEMEIGFGPDPDEQFENPDEFRDLAQEGGAINQANVAQPGHEGHVAAAVVQ